MFQKIIKTSWNGAQNVSCWNYVVIILRIEIEAINKPHAVMSFPVPLTFDRITATESANDTIDTATADINDMESRQE